MNWLTKRSKEASTYGGLAAMAAGLGAIFKIDEAPAIGDAIAGGGQAFLSGMPWWQATILTAAGAAMAFKSDGDRGW